MKITTIHKNDALRLLEDGQPHDLMLWKMTTGDILSYEGAICTSHHTEGGTHNVKLPKSGLLRKFRDVMLFNIDGMDVYW